MWFYAIFSFIFSQLVSNELFDHIKRIFIWNYYVVFKGSAIAMSIAVVAIFLAIILGAHLLISLFGFCTDNEPN